MKALEILIQGLKGVRLGPCGNALSAINIFTLTLTQDFKLLSKQLTASKLVEILVKDGPSLHDSSSTNLEPEVCMKKHIMVHCYRNN